MSDKLILAAKKLLVNKRIEESLKICRAICSPLRFKVIFLLKNHPSGLTVTELARILGSSLSRISHQLRILRKCNLVVAKGENRETLYKLSNHRIKRFFSV